jgi:hypothetical protein
MLIIAGSGVGAGSGAEGNVAAGVCGITAIAGMGGAAGGMAGGVAQAASKSERMAKHERKAFLLAKTQNHP